MNRPVSNRPYRADIDGLRAIAVLAVLVFHLDSDWLAGGFLGVDIFFVISGFLITGIILSALNKQSFSLRGFHAGRIRRIFPALFVVVLCSLLVGMLVLPPSDLRALDKSAFSSLFFLANHHFAKRTDYFAPAADEQPLLHLWSLGVEIQFYLLWPLIILACHRLGLSLKTLLGLTLALALGSTLLGTWWALDPGMASWSYYLLPTRAVALLIGSALAIYTFVEKVPASSGVWQLAGFALVCVSVVLISAGDLFPGYNALWPSLAAAWIIYGSQREGPVRRLLTSGVLVHIGKISYSLYLWHWPVLAYLRYFHGDSELPLGTLMIAVACIGMLAHLSWRFIEEPIRHRRYQLGGALVRFHLLPGLLILLGAGISKATDGLPSRSVFFAEKYTEVSSDESGCYKKTKEPCVLGNAEGVNSQTLLVGDSHGGHFDGFFDTLARQENVYLAVKTHPGCSVTKLWSTTPPESGSCVRFAQTVTAQINDYAQLILASRWDELLVKRGETEFTRSLRQTLSARPSGQRIIVMAQIPKYQNDIYREWINNARFGLSVQKRLDRNYQRANKLVSEVVAQFPNANYVPVDELLCDGETCRIEIDGQPLYKDDDHLNHFGSQQLATLYRSRRGENKPSEFFSPVSAASALSPNQSDLVYRSRP